MNTSVLEKVSIRNFKSHKKTVIEFAPGLNIIIGLSDMGKTAFFDAIRWALTNSPHGDEYRSNWGGDTIVDLFFKDCPRLRRGRTNSSNYYQIKGLSRFDAIGRGGVPEKVQEFINIHPINIQFHTESSFLFTKTPPEVSRYLNEIVDLEIIDSSLYNIESERKKVASELKHAEKELEKAEEELAKYKWIDEANNSIKILQQLERDISNLEQDKQSLKKIISSIEENKKELEHIEKTIAAEDDIKELLHLQKQINKEEKQADTLKTLIKSIESKQLQVKYLDKEIKQLKKSIPDICPYCGKPLDEKETYSHISSRHTC